MNFCVRILWVGGNGRYGWEVSQNLSSCKHYFKMWENLYSYSFHRKDNLWLKYKNSGIWEICIPILAWLLRCLCHVSDARHVLQYLHGSDLLNMISTFLVLDAKLPGFLSLNFRHLQYRHLHLNKLSRLPL